MKIRQSWTRLETALGHFAYDEGPGYTTALVIGVMVVAIGACCGIVLLFINHFWVTFWASVLILVLGVILSALYVWLDRLANRAWDAKSASADRWLTDLDANKPSSKSVQDIATETGIMPEQS